MRIRAFVAGASVVVLAACAISEPPPGGPEDKTPPAVTVTHPAAGSAGVPVDASVALEFDEGMKRARVERLVEFFPAVSVVKARWRKNTMTLVLDEPLRADTTYIVRLKPGYSDAHGVRATKPFAFAFATSAHIDSGSIAGRVLFRRKPTEKGVVRLFRLPRDTAFVVDAARPDRETSTEGDGTFVFEYLPTDHAPFLVWAFEDQNGNFNFEASSEVGAAPDTVTLSPQGWSREMLDIAIVDPKEPVEITGKVANETDVDTIRISIAAHELSDSLPPTYYARAAPGGEFKLSVLQGSYVLYAFQDFRADSLCGNYPCPEDSSLTCREPCSQYPDTLRVKPGDRVQLDEWTLTADSIR